MFIINIITSISNDDIANSASKEMKTEGSMGYNEKSDYKIWNIDLISTLRARNIMTIRKEMVNTNSI